MTKLGLLLLITAALGCGGKKTTGGGTGSGSARKGSGSAARIDLSDLPAAGSGSDPLGSGTTMEGSSAMKAPMTDAARAQKFEDCWKLWSDGRFDAFGNCYALDATSEAPGSGEPAAASRAAIVEQAKGERAASPDQKGAVQLVLVSGSTVVAVAMISGTASGKPFGIEAGVVTEFGDHDDIAHEQSYLDAKTIEAQVRGTAGARAALTQATGHEVVVAKNDDTEKGNLEVIRKLRDAFGKHDAAAYGALVADGAVWSDQTLAKDDDKTALLASTKKMWAGMADARFDAVKTWAAGDYVAVQETLDGTKGGSPVSVPALAIYKLAGGKITQTQLFYQRGAMTGAAGSGSGSGH